MSGARIRNLIDSFLSGKLFTLFVIGSFIVPAIVTLYMGIKVRSVLSVLGFYWVLPALSLLWMVVYGLLMGKKTKRFTEFGMSYSVQNVAVFCVSVVWLGLFLFTDYGICGPYKTADVTVVGDTVKIHGGVIGYRSTVELIDAIEDGGPVANVDLNFIGGANFYADIAISALNKSGVKKSIIRNGSKCQSACTAFWLEFEDRVIEPKGTLHFHASAVKGWGITDQRDLERWYTNKIDRGIIEVFKTIGEHEKLCEVNGDESQALGFQKSETIRTESLHERCEAYLKFVKEKDARHQCQKLRKFCEKTK